MAGIIPQPVPTMASPQMINLTSLGFQAAGSAGGISPPAAHRTVRKPLDLHGSSQPLPCHLAMTVDAESDRSSRLLGWRPPSLSWVIRFAPRSLQALRRCRVGRGGAYALPPPARSNGSCSFPQAAFLRGRFDERGRDCSPPQRLLPRSGFPRCRRRVFRSANLSALPPCTHPFFDARRCHTARGLPPPTGLLGRIGVVTRR